MKNIHTISCQLIVRIRALTAILSAEYNQFVTQIVARIIYNKEKPASSYSIYYAYA